MSTKHYFPETAANTLVPRALRALVRANPHLTLDEPNRVVANSRNDASKVSIVSGGGSGHEPAWSGFVGDNLLSAAACGDIFASPSTKQVLAAMELAPSEKGTILLITNYTGDRLHFGLAAERVRASGLSKNVAVLAATDDVSIGRSKSSRVGRRGLPGHIVTMKILSAAAAAGWDFDRCLSLGQSVNDQTVSIGSSLDHCHVPGRQHQPYPADSCAIGAGIHNEPAQQVLSPMPAIEDVIKTCLGLLCGSDPERAFVKFEATDRVVMVINNYGGLSPLELGALTDEVQTQLRETYGIEPCRAVVGTFETSLNAPGFSVSLCNLSAVERKCGVSTDELLRLFHVPTTAASWPNVSKHEPASPAKVNGTHVEKSSIPIAIEADVSAVAVEPAVLDRAVREACNAAITAEPQLTEWDMVMGDGDCGEAVKGLCESTLALLDGGLAGTGSILPFLATLNDAVDDMGGTLGAIFGILLSAFHSAISKAAEGTSEHGAKLYAASLASAVESLKTHTAAREGDRTVMDVMIPFADVFATSGDLATAVKHAGEKAEATRYLKPKLGRASYVGEVSGQELPDPGAWAFYELVWGLAKGLGIEVERIDKR